MQLFYEPDFDLECRLCGTTPTVKILNHSVQETELCGLCFFSEPLMIDWSFWNEEQNSEE
jgi:hypothetical protein